MRIGLECETNLIYSLRGLPPPPINSLQVSQELKSPFPFRNENVETVVVDDANPFF